MKSLISLIIPVLFFASCIKEPLSKCSDQPECPECIQLSVDLFVGEKNYSNASDLGFMVDENLPFRQYISNYYYRLKNIETGLVERDSEVFTVNENDQKTNFTVSGLSNGEYELIVWGNTLLDEHRTIEHGVLHRNETEDSDLYFAIDTVSIIKEQKENLSLELIRTKGKLLIRFSNLPNEITKISKHVTNIYGSKESGNYSGITAVSKVFLKSAGQLDQIETLLAPSAAGNTSSLNLSLHADDSDTPALSIPPIEIAVKRNEITAITLNYNDLSNNLEVWIFIDEKWILVKQLDIEEI